MPLIETRGLTKLYRMGDSVVHALDGVDLTIEHGEFVAITGPSGSGKSTIMHLLGCLDRPTGGSYLLDGHDVSGLSDRELAAVRNRQIGFVFQTFNLINRTTAWENVAVPLFYARKTGLRAPAMRALERVGLSDRATHQPSELSGGERQRVAMARAIVNDPLLLMADEPTGNLDSRTGEQIMQIVHALNEQGVTVIVVTHEPDIARQADRIVQMRDGKIVSDKPTLGMPAATRRPSVVELPPNEGLPPETIPIADEQPTGVPEIASLPPRMVRGATAGLICGLIAASLWLLAIGTQVGLTMAYDMEAIQKAATQTPPKLPPTGVIVGSLAASASILAAIVLGILAIVFSVGARKRMRREIGNWLGRRRIWIGLGLGCVAVGLPVVAIAVRIVTSLAKGS